MKKTMLVALVVIFVFAFATAAFAATTGNNETNTWNPAGPTYRAPGAAGQSQRGAADGLWDAAEGSPHQGYATNTNKCEVCHSPHQAGVGGTSYKLLYGTTSASGDQAACEYCHVAGNLTIKDVFNASAGYTIRGGHDLAAAVTNIPDATWGQTTEAFSCSNCHTVHGANAVLFAGVKTWILKANPTWGAAVAPTAATNDNMSSYCAACHDMNYDTTVNDDSHYMGSRTAAGSTRGATEVASADSTACSNCHAAPRSGGLFDTAPNWPHQSDSIVGLGTGSSGTTVTAQTAMDDHCMKCHDQIGTAY